MPITIAKVTNDEIYCLVEECSYPKAWDVLRGSDVSARVALKMIEADPFNLERVNPSKENQIAAAKIDAKALYYMRCKKVYKQAQLIAVAQSEHALGWIEGGNEGNYRKVSKKAKKLHLVLYPDYFK